MVLDTASLEAITQEIRTCFLYEDAPDHLSILDAGIRQLRAEDSTTVESYEYTTLMRVAHSLKGGAGIAQFLTLSHLVHKLEDLLLALQQKRVPEPNCAFELLCVSVEQITTLIAAATSNQLEAFDHVAAQTTLSPTLAQIESFIQNLPQLEETHEYRPTTEESRRSGEQREAGEQTSKTGVLPSGWKAKILIVDDAIAFRQILERILTIAGYQVVQCRNGKEAQDLLSSPDEQFELVISDIEMPQVNGFELLKEIRRHPRWHNLPVMMLTSRENPLHRQTASNLGATGYFTKPFHADELLSAIAALLPATITSTLLKFTHDSDFDRR